jgi:hypothetical protein
VRLADTNDVLRRFNRETGLLTTLVVGATISAALMMAVMVQDRHSTEPDLAELAAPTGGELLPNGNYALPTSEAGLPAKISVGEITTGQARSVDHSFTEIFPEKSPSVAVEDSTPMTALSSVSEIDRPKTEAIAPSRFRSRRPAPLRAIRRKVRGERYLSAGMLGTVRAKMQLIALWHRDRVGDRGNRIGVSAYRRFGD